MTALRENRNCARTYATFRLKGDALEPGEVTDALRLEPSSSGVEGERLRRGRELRSRQIGVWLLRSDGAVESTSLERHLLYLLDMLEPSTAALAALRSQRTISADFFCYWLSATGHGGPEISSATLARIAALDADIGLDFYGAGDAQ